MAQKVISVAQQVTGKPTGEEALAAINADPALGLQFRQAMLAQETAIDQLAVQNAADVNKSLQVEAAAEHWPTYSWRPAIGFATALTLTLVAIVVLIAYGGVILANRNPAALAYIPGMIGAVAALLGAGAMPVLGIASWYRGKMQADPSIPTINKG